MEVSDGLCSSAKSTRVVQSKGPLDAALAKRLGLEPDVVADSKTMPLNQNPWICLTLASDPSIRLLSLLDGKLTIVRAQHPNGGYVCYMTFAATWDPNRWECVDPEANVPFPKAVAFTLQVENADGGLLKNFIFADFVKCPAWDNFPSDARENLDPDIYDVAERFSIRPNAGSIWKACPAN